MECGKTIPGGLPGVTCALDKEHSGSCAATEAANARRLVHPSSGEAGLAAFDRTADEDLADLLERRTGAHGGGIDATFLMAIRTAIARLRRGR